MVALELLIDATGMQRGARDAQRALDDVNVSATKTARTVDDVGVRMGKAFQATGSTVSAASSIAQAAKSFGDLNIAAGAFSASRSILDVARVSQDFAALRTSVGASGGAFSTLGAIMRAHPLLTIASVVATAASAVSLFTSETKSLAISWESLGERMAKVRLDNAVARGLGIISPDSTKDYQANIRDAYGNSLLGQGSTVGELSKSTGIGGLDAIRYLASKGNARALEYMHTGEIQKTFGEGFVGGIGGDSTATISPGSLSLTPSQVQDLLREQYRKVSFTPPNAGDVYQFGAENSLNRNRTLLEIGPYAKNAGPGPNYVEQDRQEKAAQQWEIHFARIEESMRNAERYATGIGQNLGSVAYDVLAGVNSLRGALAQLVGSTARQGLSSIGGALVGSLGAAVGKTFAQGSEDQGINWRGGVGNEDYGPN